MKGKLCCSASELATVLAALRKFQKLAVDEVCDMEHFADHEPLNDTEIDALCDRIGVELAIPGNHEKDSDCDVDDDTNTCIVCGVYHDDPCEVCGGRAFHKARCVRSDENVLTEDDCTCDDRSWAGPNHDSACELEGARLTE